MLHYPLSQQLLCPLYWIHQEYLLSLLLQSPLSGMCILPLYVGLSLSWSPLSHSGLTLSGSGPVKCWSSHQQSQPHPWHLVTLSWRFPLSWRLDRFIKFADDTTVVGLISNRDETNYRSEVSRLAGWCSEDNLSLNVEKMKEIVVDFRRVHTQHAPLTINGATVERVSSTKFLGVHITEDLSWTNNTAALAKKAQQRLYFLRKLRRARAPAPIMCTFYRGTIESILTSCITVWYGACNASCRKSLQRIVRAAEKIVGVSLPSLQDIYNTRLTRKALSIAGDPTHPTHNFFSLLPSGRRLMSLQARTNRLKDSFIHQAVRKLNSLPSLPPPPLLPHESLNSVPHPTTTTHTFTHTLTLTMRQAPVTCTALYTPCHFK